MLNLSMGRMDQAKFFFQTTLKQCGPVLPALLGMAAVLFGEGDFQGAQDKYGETIKRFPNSGASVRVGFGLASYRLGQVDRAKAAFRRALDIDPECVEAMVGSAILDMAGMDESAKDFSSRTEKAIKMMSMANLLDHSNAMVQNHLANHYFWKWTPVVGTVNVKEGSKTVTSSQPIPLEVGERIRIGTKFETTVVEDNSDDESATFKIQDAWKGEANDNLKVWKKDYDRVITLAKGAYKSTKVQEIQAESLFFLARVYHVRGDIDDAHKFYDKACKLAPDLTPARFGLAQTLVVKEEYNLAMEELNRLLTTSGPTTDTLALLGLLEVRSGKTFDEGLVHLRKAIELDPLNPELYVLEALALQQHKTNYGISLQRYKKAIDIMKRKGDPVPFDILNNGGVLCHETRKYDEALMMYKLALEALDNGGTMRVVTLENEGIQDAPIRDRENDMFCGFVDTGLKAEVVAGEKRLKIVVPEDFDIDAFNVKVGDRVKLDENETEVTNVEKNGNHVSLEIAHSFDVDTSFGEGATRPLLVKRENNLLNIPEATTVVFNIARLHEATGKTLAAIELHKAILKRNPAYVNSSLRLACIAADCGCLKECSDWLKISATTAPGNPEVLTLIGNLHLSLCDWGAAQPVFDNLLVKKVPNVEAYASLSLGTLYFANVHGFGEDRYVKHLKYASDFYTRILMKDPSNAYAANGVGTVLAEKAEILKAKDIFNRVREVSDDTIADALLNLGHIQLANKKHPEAIQMYENYLKHVEDGTTPITSKSRTEDVCDVLLYIAFAYFDWARHTELSNDANAAPADERYKQAMSYLERALENNSKKHVVLEYDLCMTKLQAANCILQKLTRNIPRTAEEVEEALVGLQESLKIVERIIEEKNDPTKKVAIPSSTLQTFVNNCKANIASAESHLEDERNRAKDNEDEARIRKLAAEAERKAEEIEKQLRLAQEAKLQEERDQKARQKMEKVQQLRHTWQQEQEAKDAGKDKKKKRQKGGQEDDFLVEEDEAGPTSHGLFDDSDESDEEGDDKGESVKPESDKPAPSAATQQDLFGDSDDDDDAAGNAGGDKPAAESGKASNQDLFGDSDSDEDAPAKPSANENKPKAGATEDLFGDSDEDSDEELIPDSKRKAEAGSDQASKKRRVLDDDDDD